MWFQMLFQFIVAPAGVASMTVPSARQAATIAITFRLLISNMSVLPDRMYSDLTGRGRRIFPSGGRRYDESVSSLTPQQEPETRRYELDPPLEDAEPARDYEPIHPRGRLGELGRKLWAPIAAAGLLVFKFKTAILALFKLKIFATSASMLVSIAAYGWIWGWRFAVGFVFLLLVHELGHVAELRRQGVPASAPLFIPFLGAVVGMKQMPHNVWKEAQVALAGPIVGSLAAAGLWAAGEALDSDLLVALAFTGFFLNLFNLIPVSPLDGGRAVAALHPALWAVGLVLLLGLTLLRPNVILLLVLVVGGMEVWRRWRDRNEPSVAGYYAIERWQRAVVAVTYVGLAALLAVAMAATHLERTFWGRRGAQGPPDPGEQRGRGAPPRPKDRRRVPARLRHGRRAAEAGRDGLRLGPDRGGPPRLRLGARGRAPLRRGRVHGRHRRRARGDGSGEPRRP
jgi:Zn-dependent protease